MPTPTAVITILGTVRYLLGECPWRPQYAVHGQPSPSSRLYRVSNTDKGRHSPVESIPIDPSRGMVKSLAGKTAALVRYLLYLSLFLWGAAVILFFALAQVAYPVTLSKDGHPRPYWGMSYISYLLLILTIVPDRPCTNHTIGLRCSRMVICSKNVSLVHFRWVIPDKFLETSTFVVST